MSSSPLQESEEDNKNEERPINSSSPPMRSRQSRSLSENIELLSPRQRLLPEQNRRAEQDPLELEAQSHRRLQLSPQEQAARDELFLRTTRECRICFLTTESSHDYLVNPCSCRGTMKYVHEKCLLRWLTEKNILRCELCKQTIHVKKVFILKKLIQIIAMDLKLLFTNRDSFIKLLLQGVCFIVYLRHFLPIVRYIRTKMLRDVCKLWLLFEQEEKLRNAYKFCWRMKVKQVVYQEIPITIKLMVLMWVLRSFVGYGASRLFRIIVFVYTRWYQKSQELRLTDRGQTKKLNRDIQSIRGIISNRIGQQLQRAAIEAQM